MAPSFVAVRVADPATGPPLFTGAVPMRTGLYRVLRVFKGCVFCGCHKDTAVWSRVCTADVVLDMGQWVRD